MMPTSIQWHDVLTACAVWTFARSSGPGGQNVNKVNSKAILCIPIEALTFLSYQQRQTLRIKLASRIVDDGLTIHVQDRRSQLENRELALLRAEELLRTALVPSVPRHKTKPTRASKERRLTAKRITSAHKENRSGPRED